MMATAKTSPGAKLRGFVFVLTPILSNAILRLSNLPSFSEKNHEGPCGVRFQ